MTKRKEIILYSILSVYILFLLYVGVLNRVSTDERVVWLDLLGGYLHPRHNSISDGLFNICLFIPIGVLVAFLAKKSRIGKAMFVGWLVSIVIEFSQLIWKRGIFDVDDFLNDVVGAFIGGVLVVFVMNICKTKRI